jgi:hypothetical protein
MTRLFSGAIVAGRRQRAPGEVLLVRASLLKHHCVFLIANAFKYGRTRLNLPPAFFFVECVVTRYSADESSPPVLPALRVAMWGLGHGRRGRQ